MQLFRTHEACHLAGHPFGSGGSYWTWLGPWKTLTDSPLWGWSFVLEFPGLCLV